MLPEKLSGAILPFDSPPPTVKLGTSVAIEPDVEPLMRSRTLDVVGEVAVQPDRDPVFAVHRKVVVDGDTAARSERQVFTQPLVLTQVGMRSRRCRLSGRRRGGPTASRVILRAALR